jgi:hypothetical protein
VGGEGGVTVYVDSLFNGAAFTKDAATRRVGARNRHRWCHLTADALEELHAIARRIGLREEWFQGDHYDLTPSRRARTLSLGAVEVTRRELVQVVRRLRASIRSPRQQWERWQREGRPTVGANKPLLDYLVSQAEWHVGTAVIADVKGEPVPLDVLPTLRATVADLLQLARERGVLPIPAVHPAAPTEP